MRQIKVFISHSWQDKFLVLKMVEKLRTIPFLHIWVDAEQLQPGARIQTEIDQELMTTDVVILVWSQHAMQSKGVREEMRTSERLQKRLVICKLDKTPLPGSWLPQMKSVNLIDDPALGIGRLAASMFNLVPAEWKAALPPEMLEQWNQYTGDLEVTNHFAYHNKPADHQKQEVADYMQEKLDAKKTRLDSHLNEAKMVGDAINGYMVRIENQLGNPNALMEILLDVKASVHLKHPMFQMFMGKFEQMIQPKSQESGFANQTASAHPGTTFTENRGPQAIPEQYIRSINQFRQKIEAKRHTTYQFCQGTFGFILGKESFDNKFNAFVYFFTSAADVLQDMVNSYYRQGNEHPKLYDSIVRLTKYLDDENAGLPDSHGGLIGLIDDAYLIHKALPGLKSIGAMPDTHLSLDTSKINTALTWIEVLVSAAVIAALNQTVQKWQEENDGWAKVRAGRASIEEARLRSLATDAGIDW
jgi:hypothetical protein